MKMLFFLSVLLGLFGGIWCQDVFLQPPSGQTGPDKLLIFIQGARVPPANYTDLFRAIQKSVYFRLWVFAPEFLFDFANPLEIDFKISQAFDTVRKAGWTNISEADDTFLAGHSLGGIMARSAALSHQFQMGLILYGSFLENAGDADLSNYLLPVLQVGGELDGVCRVTRIMNEFGQFLDLQKNAGIEESLKKFPVVIIPGICHSQFDNGYPQAGDLIPEISVQEAHNRIAAITAAFMEVQVYPNDDLTPQLQLLSDAVNTTFQLSNGYLVAQQIDDSSWCHDTQYILANLSSSDSSKLQVKSTHETDFITFTEDKPSISGDASGATVQTYFYLTYNFQDWLDTGADLVASGSIACKMKSQENIKKVLQLTSSGSEGSCKDANAQAMKMALKLMSDRAYQRYQAKGRQIVLKDDVEYDTGFTWLSADLSVSITQKTIEIASPTLETGMDNPLFPTLAGQHYCKLLSVGGAMERMLLDALKP